MAFHLIASVSLLTGISAHSWADSVAGGSYRGAQGANDLVKQRYFCPLATLEACQPPAKHGIILSAEAMRPCRTDLPTPNWGNAISGQPMYVHWAGNGHTGSEGAGTCVTIKIAPYALDPPMSSFRLLASCLPYSHDGVITDANVMLPADLPSGEYTVLWQWDFPPFWFSSCSDIRVSGGSGSTTTPIATSPVTTRAPTSAPRTVSTSRAPIPSTQPPASTVSTSSTPSTARAATSSGTLPIHVGDCKKYIKPNQQCALQYGPSSYCVSWVQDKCGRSHCTGTTFDDSKC